MLRKEIPGQPESDQVRGTIIYVPGLPGDTLEKFEKVASQWSLSGKKWKVDGIPHDGLMANDWVKEVRVAIIKALSNGLPMTLVGHSFGGLLAITALAELVDEGRIAENQYHKIRFIAVSAPFYQESSLPDKKPLLGLDSVQSFTFYRDSESDEKMSQSDNRIPMSSKYAFEHIWGYLRGCNSMRVCSEEAKFNANLLDLFKELRRKVTVLTKTGINIVTLFPRQDRWVGKRSGADLQEILGKPILVEEFDIPSSSLRSMTGFNAHDEVAEWAPVVYKCL